VSALEPADGPPPRVMVLRCSGLCRPAAEPQDPGAARLLDRVIAVVTGFCPDVELVEPGICAFAARGPARYFGGETALATRIIAALADLGVQARAGVADGLFAALLAAGGSDAIVVVPPGRSARFLAAQPVSVLPDRDPAGEDLAALLSRLGLGTLGDFAALPACDVASRFGYPGERLAVSGEPPRRVTGWAGPWPLAERWWDPAAARRRARFQLATDDGLAWLAVVQDGSWLVEAGYR